MMNYYETMGIDLTATIEEIKQAYRKLSLKFHPDKNSGDTYFEEWTKKINEAYEVLSNPAKRKEYDRGFFSKECNSAANESSSTKAKYENTHDKKADILRQIRQLTPAYLKARAEYQHAFREHQDQFEKPISKKFGVKQVLVSIIMILVGVIGMKKADGFSPKQGLEETTQNEAKGTFKKQIGTSKATGYQKSKPEIEMPDDAEDVLQSYNIISDKAYLYYSPISGEISVNYLVRGTKISATKQYSNFLYCESKNRKGKTIRGWLNQNDIEQETGEAINEVKNEVVLSNGIRNNQDTTELTSTVDSSLFNEPLKVSILPKDSLPKKKRGLFKRLFGKKE